MFNWILNTPLDEKLVTHRLFESQIAARKLLGLHYTDTQLAGRILESLIKSVLTLFWCYINYFEQIINSDFIQLGLNDWMSVIIFPESQSKYEIIFTWFLCKFNKFFSRNSRSFTEYLKVLQFTLEVLLFSSNPL